MFRHFFFISAQHGFRNRNSKEQAIHKLTRNLYKNLWQIKQPNNSVVDLSKVLDTLSHNPLI